MDTSRLDWRRTSLTILVLGALVFAPFVVAKARHENWNVNDITSRMPWHDPALAGEITGDKAAADACATAPTFDVTEDDAGARVHFGGPLTLEQANERLVELGVPLELGLQPTDPIGRQPAVAGISHGGGDPVVARVLEGATTVTGMLLSPIAVPAESGPAGLIITCPGVGAEGETLPHPFAPGGVLACSGIPEMSPAEAHAWLDERFEQVKVFRHRGPTTSEVTEIPDEAALVWADVNPDDSARVGIALPGDPQFEDGWRVPDLGGCG